MKAHNLIKNRHNNADIVLRSLQKVLRTPFLRKNSCGCFCIEIIVYMLRFTDWKLQNKRTRISGNSLIVFLLIKTVYNRRDYFLSISKYFIAIK